MAVKNDNEVFFVPLCLSARNGPAMTGRFCTAVSKMRVSGVQNEGSPQLRELKARKARKARKVESWEPEYIPLFPYFPEVKTSHAMGVPPAIAGMAAGNPEPENFHFSVSVILYMKINILF